MPDEIRQQSVKLPSGEVQPLKVQVLATGSREARREAARERREAARRPQPQTKTDTPAS